MIRAVPARPDAAPSLATLVERLTVGIEPWAALYLMVIAAGGLGFFDTMAYGRGGVVATDVSLPSRIVWPVAYLLFGALILLRATELPAAVAPVAWLGLFPLVAALSTAWSIDPPLTAGSAFRLAFATAMGAYIGMRFSTRSIAWLVFWPLAGTVALSILTFAAGLDFAVMFDGTARGLFHHKNTLGNRSALLVATALALLLARNRPTVALAGLAVALIGLAIARSGTSIIAAGVVMLAPSILVLRAKPLTRALWLAIGLGTGGLVAAGLLIARIDPVTEFLDLLGKDITLTGRSLLWQAASHQIEARPWLGIGFDAFWNSYIDWRTHLVRDVMGPVLHFHNTYIDIAVQLGIVGVVAVLIQLWVYCRLAGRMLLRSPDRTGAWPSLFLIVPLVATLVEYEIFLRHNLYNIVLVALAVAMAREIAWHRRSMLRGA